MKSLRRQKQCDLWSRYLRVMLRNKGYDSVAGQMTEREVRNVTWMIRHIKMYG